MQVLLLLLRLQAAAASRLAGKRHAARTPRRPHRKSLDAMPAALAGGPPAPQPPSRRSSARRVSVTLRTRAWHSRRRRLTIDDYFQAAPPKATALSSLRSPCLGCCSRRRRDARPARLPTVDAGVCSASASNDVSDLRAGGPRGARGARQPGAHAAGGHHAADRGHIRRQGARTLPRSASHALHLHCPPRRSAPAASRLRSHRRRGCARRGCVQCADARHRRARPSTPPPPPLGCASAGPVCDAV